MLKHHNSHAEYEVHVSYFPTLWAAPKTLTPMLSMVPSKGKGRLSK